MTKINNEKLSVDSSAIITISYSYESNQLSVTFVNGKTYLFNKVQSDEFLSLKYAESIGKYFNRHIKNNYNYELLQPIKK
jgi:hypothetical protein